ncbi:hypothetical protein [Streptomyces sp. NPDC094049]|uniref:hypothetical protein n=1 Tax=Streptomyces sp. NPDC094049 TaxID=3154987 RepID=UPI0033269529
MKRSTSSEYDRPVLLPSEAGWSADVRLVSRVLEIAQAAAENYPDDFIEPSVTWQIASEAIGDCATTDNRPENVRILILQPHVLKAVWACHQALGRALHRDDDAERLADLLTPYLHMVRETDLRSTIDTLERVLAVVALDLPAARTLATRIALSGNLGDTGRAALDEILAAWRRAGIAA